MAGVARWEGGRRVSTEETSRPKCAPDLYGRWRKRTPPGTRWGFWPSSEATLRRPVDAAVPQQEGEP
jgi:hypothetical protein